MKIKFPPPDPMWELVREVRDLLGENFVTGAWSESTLVVGESGGYAWAHIRFDRKKGALIARIQWASTLVESDPEDGLHRVCIEHKLPTRSVHASDRIAFGALVQETLLNSKSDFLDAADPRRVYRIAHRVCHAVLNGDEGLLESLRAEMALAEKLLMDELAQREKWDGMGLFWVHLLLELPASDLETAQGLVRRNADEIRSVLFGKSLV